MYTQWAIQIFWGSIHIRDPTRDDWMRPSVYYMSLYLIFCFLFSKRLQSFISKEQYMLKRKKYFYMYQRSYQRWLDKVIYKTEMKFWAVLGSQGCREKNTPNCYKYATFWGGFFIFLWAKKSLEFKKKYFSIRTEKLHSIKTKKILKIFGKDFILDWNRLQTYFEISL